jgi:hypothetical protein
MRTRLIVATIAGLLFCTLAALEFPELVTLSNDTSNDYSLAIFPRSEGAAVQKQIVADFPAEPTATNRKTEQPLMRVRFSDPSHGITDSLHLLCIQRT